MTTALEAVARAICAKQHRRDDAEWPLYTREARIAIEAFLEHLESARWQLVPVEERDGMLSAAIAAEDDDGDGDTWSAKLLAAPGFDPEVM